ncbi:MAG: hypothetical protein WA211_08600 [Candidatus Acidiferrales bacterium]
MLDESLQEWEEYDARILDDSQSVAHTAAAPSSRQEFPPTRVTLQASMQTPFLFNDAGELSAEPVLGLEAPSNKLATMKPIQPSAYPKPVIPPPPPPASGCGCASSSGGAGAGPVSGETNPSRAAENIEAMELSPLPDPASHAQSVGDAHEAHFTADSFEFDPYWDVRPSLRPEHRNLGEGELTIAVGPRPMLIVLHNMLASPQPRMAALAALLGGAGRRSMKVGGTDVPVPAYLRRLSRLCHEAAEHAEDEAGPQVDRQVAPDPPVSPLARDLREDAFFEDEWAPTPTPLPNPRHVHFNRFTTLTAATATALATVTAQTVFAGKPNPLDPRVTPHLLQPEVIPSSRPASHDESYWIYVPPAFTASVNKALRDGKSPPTARVSVLFGVGAEVNRHGLRSFFANTADCVLIEVGGIESQPESPDPWAIGITDAMIGDLLHQALGAAVSYELDVLAAYSTGYRGLNGTINNALVALTNLKKLIFYDCLYRGDQPKAPKGAIMPPKRHREAPASSAFNTWRAIHAVAAAGPDCKIIVYDVTPGGTPTYSDGARKVEIPGATFIKLKPLNVELKAIILARLMDNGIKDGYFSAAKVPASISALIPLLPKRGTLSSDTSSKSPGTIGRWASDHAAKIAHAMKEFGVPMELARKYKLMGWETPATEFGHDGFLPEFGWEHLPG